MSWIKAAYKTYLLFTSLFGTGKMRFSSEELFADECLVSAWAFMPGIMMDVIFWHVLRSYMPWNIIINIIINNQYINVVFLIGCFHGVFKRIQFPSRSMGHSPASRGRDAPDFDETKSDVCLGCKQQSVDDGALGWLARSWWSFVGVYSV